MEYPILYTFRRCPYAMRARMALYVSNQIFEIREVVLTRKPRHLIELSPKGTVPVLDLGTGYVLEQSIDIMCWALEQNDPLNWLNPEGGSQASMLDLISLFDNDFKLNLDRYKYPQRYKNSDAFFHRQQGEKFLINLDSRLRKSDYLFGRLPALADYAIFPFIRQFANTDRLWFDSLPYSMLQAWLTTLLNDRLFVDIMKKYPTWAPGNSPIMFQAEKTIFAT